MPKPEVEKLIADYENATPSEISMLIQKYGRHQVQKLVEDKLTKDHIKVSNLQHLNQALI